MRDDGAGMGPIHPWTRLYVAFQIVGVQLDQPRQNKVALTVDGTRQGCTAFGDCGDPAI